MIRFKNELKGNKRFFLLTLIGLISILLVVSLSTVNAAKNVTIENTTNVSDINDFFNASGVIDNNTLDVGDTVIFKEGVYRDLSLEVNKSVNIKGENATFENNLYDEPVIIINADLVNITGIKFITRNDYSDGIVVNGVNNTIVNCTFEDTGTGSYRTSILLYGDYNNVINSTFKLLNEGASGINSNGDYNLISGCTIETSGMYSRGISIYQYNTITNCTIKSQGVGISAGDYNTISGCIIESCVDGSYYGAISVYSNNNILNNKITVLNSSTGSGILIEGSNNTVSSNDINTLNSSNGSGIHILGTEWDIADNNTICNNKINSTGKTIYLNNYTSNSSIKDNIVKAGSIEDLGSGNTVSIPENKTTPPAPTPKPKPVVVKKPIVVKKADLKVAKIKRKGKYRYVYIKNIGKAKAKANKLGIYIGKKWIKTVKVKAIKAGKSIRIKVFIPKKYRAKVKTFKVDIKNKVKESREKNNARKSK